MKSRSFYWGSRHAVPSLEGELQKKLEEAERLLELCRQENLRKEEVIASQQRIIENLRQSSNAAKCETEDIRLRLDALTLGTGSCAKAPEDLKAEGTIWRGKFYELNEKYADAIRLANELKKKLNIREHNESVFGINGSPSGNRVFNPNATDEKQSKKGGAKPGHKGHGRRAHSTEHKGVILEMCEDIPVHQSCCGEEDLHKVGEMTRSYTRRIMPRIERVVVRRSVYECRNCKQRFYARPGDVLPRMAYSNDFLATSATEFLINGRTAGMTANMLHISVGVFFHMIATVADILKPLFEAILKDAVRQKFLYADETRWWNDGVKGYAWVFTNDNVVVYLMENTRGAIVPARLFGWSDPNKAFPENNEILLVEESNEYEGQLTLITDRFSGYSPVDVKHQFCFEHLKRDANKLQQESEGIEEVANFVNALKPLLKESMHLCANKTLPDKEYYREAERLKEEIRKLVYAEANDRLLQDYQNIWRKNWDSLFRWVEDRRICCENNRAERTIRPTVISRKLSFGSQSEKGANSREIIMTVLHTARIRGKEPNQFLVEILNAVSRDPNYDVTTAMPPCKTDIERKRKVLPQSSSA